MRKNCSSGIIFAGALLVGLLTSCDNKDKPKEGVVCKNAVLDTLKAKLQEKENITAEKKAISNERIESIAKEQQQQVPKIVLIITSQACHCTLERCAEGEKMVNEVVQQLPGKLTFERLDYAKEQDLVAQLAKEYQLRFLPALLFFDERGTFNGKLDGSLDKGEVEKKLKELSRQVGMAE